jgi:hypothetical protein
VKKTVFLFFSLVLIFQPVVGILAQEKIQLTPKQMEEYGSKKLTVTGYAIVTVDKNTGTGSAPTSSDPASKKWTATQGYESIPEWKFLRIAGYPEEAQKAKKRRNIYVGLLVGGSVLLAGGMAATLLPMLSTSSSDDSGLGPIFWAGTGASIAGSAALLVSIPLGGKITPVGKAQTMAENYNRELAQEIKQR